MPFQYCGNPWWFISNMEFLHSVGGVDDLSYFDYVFGVVNGVYAEV